MSLLKQETLTIPTKELINDDLGLYVTEDVGVLRFYTQKPIWNSNTKVINFGSQEQKLNFLRYFLFNHRVKLDSAARVCGSTATGQYRNHWSDPLITSIASGWYFGNFEELKKFKNDIQIHLPFCNHSVKAYLPDQKNQRTLLKFCGNCIQYATCLPTNLVSQSYFLEPKDLLKKMIWNDLKNNFDPDASDQELEEVLSNLKLEDYLSSEIIHLLPLRFNCNN